jgi:hypothetical protein
MTFKNKIKNNLLPRYISTFSFGMWRQHSYLSLLMIHIKPTQSIYKYTNLLWFYFNPKRSSSSWTSSTTYSVIYSCFTSGAYPVRRSIRHRTVLRYGTTQSWLKKIIKSIKVFKKCLILIILTVYFASSWQLCNFHDCISLCMWVCVCVCVCVCLYMY